MIRKYKFMINIISYPFLPDDAKMIRDEVFVQEQGFKNEFDDIDQRAIHLVMYNENKEPMATCRVFAGKENGVFLLGRLAVKKEYRGMQIGTKMINEAEKMVKQKSGESLLLHAQCRVKEFYYKLGFEKYGLVENDEGCPHIWMKKRV